MELKPQLRFRKLRIALSVVCGIAALFLVGVWARSQRWADTLIYESSSQRLYYAASCRGKFGVAQLPQELSQMVDPLGNDVFPTGFKAMHLSATGTLWEPNRNVCAQAFTNVNRVGERWGLVIPLLIVVPYWAVTVPAIVFLFAIALPFMSTRFSLRSLMIVGTLFAVILGIMALSK